MQSSSAYLDLDNPDPTSYEPNNNHWSNTRTLSIPSPSSSEPSISVHSSDSTHNLSPTNLLAEIDNNNTSSVLPLPFPSTNTITIPVHVPLSTYPLPSSTIQTTNLLNMNVQAHNVTYMFPLGSASRRVI